MRGSRPAEGGVPSRLLPPARSVIPKYKCAELLPGPTEGAAGPLSSPVLPRDLGRSRPFQTRRLRSPGVCGSFAADRLPGAPTQRASQLTSSPGPGAQRRGLPTAPAGNERTLSPA